MAKQLKPVHKAPRDAKGKPTHDSTPEGAFPDLAETEEVVRWRVPGLPDNERFSHSNSGLVHVDKDGNKFVIDGEDWVTYKLADVEHVNESNRTDAEEEAWEAARPEREAANAAAAEAAHQLSDAMKIKELEARLNQMAAQLAEKGK